MFRFTSTTLHVCVNVTTAPYFESESQILHDAVKSIIQLSPRNEITYENAINVEDGDVPTQRSGLSAQIPDGIRTQPASHSNTTKEFWLLVEKMLSYLP